MYRPTFATYQVEKNAEGRIGRIFKIGEGGGFIPPLPRKIFGGEGCKQLHPN